MSGSGGTPAGTPAGTPGRGADGHGNGGSQPPSRGQSRGGTPILSGGATPPQIGESPRTDDYGGHEGKRLSRMTMGSHSASAIAGFETAPKGSLHLLLRDPESKTRDKKADYGYLLLTRADSRNRLFGVPMDIGTFNIADRAISAAGKTTDPRGDYEPFQRGPPHRAREEDNWPRPVRGGFIFDRIEKHEDLEHFRKTGSLMPDKKQNIGRNIIGNCTIKDQYHTYYGHDSTHVGHHVGTYNVKQYEKRI